jgi:hypothetical protein
MFLCTVDYVIQTSHCQSLLLWNRLAQ